MNTQTKVVVVDDEQAQVDLIAAALERVNCMVVGVTNPGNAISVLRATMPDLVILDLVFYSDPIDGFELMRRMEMETAQPPILVVSGHEEALARLPPGTPFLLKPFDLIKLVTSVTHLIACAKIPPVERVHVEHLRSLCERIKATRETPARA